MNNKSLKIKRTYNRNDLMWGILMILPVVLGLSIFYIIPFFQNIFYSFTNLDSFGNWSYVGANNYKQILKDPLFYNALKNSFIYTICTVPAVMILSMFIANLLNQKIKGVGVYRTLYFLPAVTMPAAIAMIWKWILNGQYGLFNQIIGFLGFSPQAWLADPKFARWALIAVGIWMGLGMNIIYFLAGMQSIPKSLYEAATLDGAGPIKRFFTITIPSLKPTITFVLVTSVIGSLQVFDLIFLMFGSSSLSIEKTMSIVYLFYRYAIDFGQKGYGAAIAVILFIIILIITFLQITIQRRWADE